MGNVICIGDTVTGSYFGHPFTGKVKSFTVRGTCVELDNPITVHGLERDDVWVPNANDLQLVAKGAPRPVQYVQPLGLYYAR